MIFLKVVAGMALALFVLFVWVGIRIKRTTIAKLKDCTVKVRHDRDTTWIVYREPSGDTVTVEAYWVSRKNPRKMRVEFPSTLSFAEAPPPPSSGDIAQLNVPEKHSSPPLLPESKVDEIRERISQGLTKLEILHDFVRPQLSGWTSIEDGKEIYHGTDGVVQDLDP